MGGAGDAYMLTRVLWANSRPFRAVVYNNGCTLRMPSTQRTAAFKRTVHNATSSAHAVWLAIAARDRLRPNESDAGYLEYMLFSSTNEQKGTYNAYK